MGFLVEMFPSRLRFGVLKKQNVGAHLMTSIQSVCSSLRSKVLDKERHRVLDGTSHNKFDNGSGPCIFDFAGYYSEKASNVHQASCVSEGSENICKSLSRYVEPSAQKSINNLLWKLDELCISGRVREALNLLLSKGLKLDGPRCLRVIKACRSVGTISEARLIHEYIHQILGIADISINNQMLDLYDKLNSTEDVKELFDTMPLRDVTSWSILILNFARSGIGKQAVLYLSLFQKRKLQLAIPDGLHARLALEILEMMEEQALVLDVSDYFQLIEACGSAASAPQAVSIYKHIVRALGYADLTISNKILEMFVKCNLTEEARGHFDAIIHRNLTSWDLIILVCANNGLGEEALDYFNQFKGAGLKPDGAMFENIFLACGSMGAVDEGMLHFESMEVYGITPSMDHYMSIVAMLGHSGYIEEALDFVELMPVEPTVDIWRLLMNLSRGYGYIELGDHCAKIVEQLDPLKLDEQSNSGLLPTTASEIQREQEMKKGPNLPEFISGVSEFRRVEERYCEQLVVFQHLGYLRAQMRDAGYVPETQCVHLDVDEETKEAALQFHGERLALAHALITTPARQEITVANNFRCCRDCHRAVQIISGIVGRVLSLFDGKMWHHFSDGKCSCTDRW